MNDNFKSALLTEAIRIGDNLLEKAEKDQSGYSWETMGIGTNQDVTWNKSESIYTGVSGIILFFIELYKQTKEDKYLVAVKKGAQWVEKYCKDNPTHYYAFYTGRMGAAYMMLKVGELLEDSTYKQRALLIVEDCEKFLEHHATVNDLINGTSGTLLGLLHLHACTQEESLLPIIKKFTEHLIETAHIGAKGLYWDKSSKTIKGLCGFSHGTSGVAYVFLELANYFKNDDFFWLAEQAFEYENYYFEENTGNWPDFRKGYYDHETFEEHKQEYLNGNEAFFSTPGNMSAWCHGAPGIGLSRLRAFELLNNERFKKDIETAIKQTYKVTVIPKNFTTSYTVCHGNGGNAMLFLEAYRLFKKEEYTQFAEKVALDGLSEKKYISGYSKVDIEDYSLFMGNAGIGYYYLQLLEPLSTPSIVKPDILKTTSHTELKLGLSHIKKTILKRYFSKTLDRKFEPLFDRETTLEKIVRQLAEKVRSENDKRLTCIFNYEMENFKFQMGVKSDSHLEISNIVEIEKNLKFLDEAKDNNLLNLPIKTSKSTKLYSTEWDCIDIQNCTKDEYYSISIINSNGLIEHKLSDFSYLVFDCFTQPNVGHQVLERLIETYEATTKEDLNFLQKSLEDQIEQGMKSGILVMVG